MADDFFFNNIAVEIFFVSIFFDLIGKVMHPKREFVPPSYYFHGLYLYSP